MYIILINTLKQPLLITYFSIINGIKEKLTVFSK